MDKLGLSTADFTSYRQTLLTPGHQRQIHVDVLDLADGSHLRSLTANVTDGQVDYDITVTPSRSLNITFTDPGGNLGFDPDDPSEAPIHRSRLVRVHDARLVEDLGWVSCPVITGPSIDFDRTSGEVSLTVHSLEEQALGQIWQSHHFPAKSKLTDAIRWLLAAVGDVNANVPDLPHTLPKALDIHPMDAAWPHIKKLAGSLDRHPMYDGAGRFHLRPFGMRPLYRFHKALTSPATVARSTDGLFNTFLVLGHKPHGAKRRPRGVAVLQGPLSPANLGRNGVPLHLVHKVEHDHAKTSKQCQAIANRLAREKSQLRTDVSFDAIPLPFLEEHDLVTVQDDAFGSARLRMRQWSLPLGGGDPGGSDGQPMTVGSIKRVTRARIRK